MKKTNKNLNITIECAVVVALCIVFSQIVIFKMPHGGSVTLVGTAPLIILSFKRGVKAGFFAGTVYGILKAVLFFHVPPAGNFFSSMLVFMLDYLFAYSVLGFAPLFSCGIKKRRVAIFFGAFISGIIRCIIRIFSGVLIWQSYIAHKQSVWMYSIIYNSSYMIPEIIITSLICVLIDKYITFV